MKTLAQLPVSDPEPPPATPYSLRRWAAFETTVADERARRLLRSAAVLEAVEAEKARRLGLPPAA